MIQFQFFFLDPIQEFLLELNKRNFFAVHLSEKKAFGGRRDGLQDAVIMKI
jgi:hypothetical protein